MFVHVSKDYDGVKPYFEGGIKIYKNEGWSFFNKKT